MRTLPWGWLVLSLSGSACDTAKATARTQQQRSQASAAAVSLTRDRSTDELQAAGNEATGAQEIEATTDAKVPEHDGPAVEDPTGAALLPFYASLFRTEAKQPGAVTRVLHMGDSSIGLDGLPHALRHRMMDRFGDAGPGFVLIDRYSKNYKSNVASLKAEGWDVCYIAYLCRKDGRYGLGGHAFRGRRGAWASIGTPGRGPYGRRVSKFEVWYAKGTRTGRFQVKVDGEEPQIVETRSEEPADAWYELRVEPGEHTLQLRAAGHGQARLYGVVMENDGPGVVWDTVSMIGAFTKRLHGYDETHVREQIRHRRPDLLMLNYGGNDLRRLVARSVTPDAYKEEYRHVLRKLRGDDGPPCLVVSVIDHGRSGNYDVEPRHVAAMVQAQREVAFEEGCAFFDSVGAMGGPGSLRKWRRRNPPLAEPDLKHLNHRGRDAIAQMMFEALMAGYAGWQRAAASK